jgi:hypothetical protein
MNRAQMYTYQFQVQSLEIDYVGLLKKFRKFFFVGGILSQSKNCDERAVRNKLFSKK